MNSLKFAKHLGTRILLIAVFLLPLIAGFATPAYADDDKGDNSHRVYTMTNSASGNEVVEIQHKDDGSLPINFFSGAGKRRGLSHSSVIRSDGRWLFVVNAADSFRSPCENGLALTDSSLSAH